MKRAEFKNKPLSAYKCANRCGKQAAIATPVNKFCSFDCATKYGKKKADQKKELEFKERKAKFKDNDLAKQHELTQKVFNRVRVKQEKLWFYKQNREPECISCGKTNMDWCCGHYKTRGSSGALRYDEKNTYLQCNRYCNCGLSGNINGNATTRGYTQGLLDRFGIEEGQAAVDYCDANQGNIKKWTAQEVKQLRNSYLDIEKIIDKTISFYL